MKKTRFLALSDEKEEEKVVQKKNSHKRKLVNDFDGVGDINDDGDDDDLIGVTTRSKLLKGVDEIKKVNVSPKKATKNAKNWKIDIRTSLTLAKHRLKKN